MNFGNSSALTAAVGSGSAHAYGEVSGAAKAIRPGIPNEDDTFSKLPAAAWPQRPMLVFVHLEKSAGSYLGHLISAALPRDVLRHHTTGVALPRVPDYYFVVSSIRNPCTQSVSQWSYCCEKAWAQQEFGEQNPAATQGAKSMLQAGDCPRFRRNETDHSIHVDEPNTAGFQRYVQKNPTFYESQFNITFHDVGPGRVNCWVRVENLEGDTRHCLREYERWSGYKADWAVLNKEFRSNRGHHGACQAYYSPEEGQRRLNDNWFLFNYFGYSSCCDAE